VPGGLLRLGLGEAAEVVLGSRRVESARLQALGFQPRFPELDGAMSGGDGRYRAQASGVRLSKCTSARSTSHEGTATSFTR